MNINKKAFTLIELLIVIGIIAILASGVIVAINPGQQFAQARDATRESHINTLHSGLISYQISNQGNLSGLPITSTPTEICNTNEVSSENCGTLVDLSTLTADGYINSLPVDPQGGVDANGTGYFVAEGSIILVAEKAETRFIGIGTTESEYAGSGGETETFSCATEGQGEHTVDGDTIYCDASDNMWSPTLDLPATGSNATDYIWSTNCNGVVTGCDSSTDGEANTTCILSACDDSGVNAAEQCDALTYAGETDWYLPAENTLDGLYNECISNQGLTDGDSCLPTFDSNATSINYWSSTEVDDTMAGVMIFMNGNLSGNYKDENYWVRCVRK